MVITKTGVQVEILKRQKNVTTSSKVILNDLFKQQNLFVVDGSRYIAACCTRRAGKSSALALKFLMTMERHPKSQSLYLSLTQESARQIMWGILQEMDDRYKLNLKFGESSLTVTHPNGAKLRLMGADLSNFIRRLRGRKFAGVAIDEAQEFSDHIRELIDDILTPSIADYSDGWLAVTGTPGAVPHGLFFEITQENQGGYSNHKWSILDNPYMPDAYKFIEDLKARRNWADDNPTLRREWRGEWVLDVNSLWVQYNEKINHYDILPTEHKWAYVMGVDLGYNDADAIAVLAWSETSPTTYLVEEIIKQKQGISSLIAQIESVQKKYNAYKIVLDEGGLGKKIAEDLRQRFGCPIEPADKAHKQSNVEFLNDSMRLGKFKAHSASRFAKDSYLVQIDWDKSTPNRIIVKKKPHSDIIDAVLYAFRESYSYSHRPKELDKPSWGSKAWAEAQSDSMFEAELEGLMKEQEYTKWEKGEY